MAKKKEVPTVNPPPSEDNVGAVLSFGEVAETTDEHQVAVNKKYAAKNELELELKNTELDTERLFQAGRQLFKNACDYIKTVIIPVHSDNEVLKKYSTVLSDLVGVLESWSEGIGIGHDIDWESILERINNIQIKTEELFDKEIEYKKSKVEPIKEELKRVNKELKELESKLPKV